VSLTFDPSFVQTLITNGVVPSAIAPGTLDASTFTLKLPIASGTVDKTGKNATLKLKGGEDLTKSSTQTTRTVTNLVVKIKSGKVTVTGDAGDGTTVVLPGAPFLNGTGSGTKTNKKFTFTVKSVTITPEAAADLNAQFGTTVAAGTPVGTGKVSAAK
jgi:hypothetical protein